MKCSNCGAILNKSDNLLYCPYCGGKFFKEEIVPPVQYIGASAGVQKTAIDFTVRGGVLISYNGSNPNVVIPNGIVSIGANAFKNNVAINSVTFSDTVKSIESNAFEGCVNLHAISNYQNVESFGSESFRGAGLRSIVIGDNVKQIGKNCFTRMPNLESVKYVPSRNLKLNHAFAYNSKLTSVEMDKFYFFPSFHSSLEVLNNPTNTRPTYYDAFAETPFLSMIMKELLEVYKTGICPECGGKIKKGLFHAKCVNCGIDYRN